MNPLELEMYHQIKNVIGVNPSFYEYLFMVDADTTVDPLSLNRLISAYVYFLGLLIIYLTKMLGSMIHDKKLLGVCGETELANAKQSLITMMQVRAWKFCLILTWHLIFWLLGLRILHLSPHGEGIRKSFRVCYLSSRLFHALQIANA